MGSVGVPAAPGCGRRGHRGRRVTIEPIVAFHVPGRPRPQGSKRHIGNGVMIESSRHMKPWRSDVRETAHMAMHQTGRDLPTPAPVSLVVWFTFTRPKSHLTTKGGLNAVGRRTPYPMGVGDIDKLVRAICDAMTGAVWHDDRQVIRVEASKQYGDAAGAEIAVWDATPLDDPEWGRTAVVG